MINGKFFALGLSVAGTALFVMAPQRAEAHFSFRPHSHHVVEIFGSYPEEGKAVGLREVCNGSESTTSEFTHTDRFEARNGWGIGIGFAYNVVSAAVRFDVNQTRVVQDTYRQPIEPMTCIRLSRTQVFEVTWFLGRTRWLDGDDYAIGYAGEFLYPRYSTVEFDI